MQPLTYLQLVGRLREKCGVSGSNPTTLSGLTGEMLRLANWINDAWMEIQNLHADSWKFLETDYQFNSVAGTQSYSPETILIDSNLLGSWKRDSNRIWLTSIGFSNEMILPFWTYSLFRNMYQYGTMRTNKMRPVVWSEDQNKNFLLGATPDDVYTIVGKYYRQPSEMSGNSDAPSMPAQFHMLIVFAAMKKYGAYEAAPDVFNEGETEYKKLLSKLMVDQLPDMDFGGPLA